MRRVVVRGGPLLAIVAEGFLSRLSFGIVSFALALYAYRLGLGFGEIGVLLSVNVVVAMILKLPAGSLADRIGYRPVLILALSLRVVVPLLLAFAVSPWHLFAIRGLHGVSIALRDPATASLIAVHGGRKRVASSFAWYQTAKSVAGSLGKGLGGILLALTSSSFTLVFLVAFVLSGLPLWAVVRYVRGAPAEAPPAAEPVAAEAAVDVAPAAAVGLAWRRLGAAMWERPPLFSAALLGFLVTGTAYMMANLLPVLAVEYAGLTEGQTGLLFVFGSVVTLAGPGFGWMSDRLSHRLVLRVRSVANIVSSVAYLVAPGFAGFLAGKLTDDLGKAAFKPAWGALMALVAEMDPRRRARAMSVASLGEDAGEAVGPLLAGLLWSVWGVAALLGARIGFAVLAEVYAFRLERRLGLAPGRAEPGSTPPATADLFTHAEAEQRQPR